MAKSNGSGGGTAATLRRKLFLFGAIGLMTPHLIFWFRHADVGLAEAEKIGVVASIITAVVFLFFAAVAGVIAVYSKAPGVKEALTAGMGMASVIFAIDIGSDLSDSGSEDASTNGATVVLVADHMGRAVPVSLLADSSDAKSWSWRNVVGMALAPVSTVRRHEEERIEERNTRERVRLVRDNETQQSELRGRFDVSEARAKEADRRFEETRKRNESLDGEVLTLRTTLKERETTLSEREERLSQERERIVALNKDMERVTAERKAAVEAVVEMGVELLASREQFAEMQLLADGAMMLRVENEGLQGKLAEFAERERTWQRRIKDLELQIERGGDERSMTELAGAIVGLGSVYRREGGFNPRSQVERLLANVLGLLGKDAVTPLITALDGPVADDKYAAVFALGQLRSEAAAALPKLEQLSRDDADRQMMVLARQARRLIRGN